MPKKKLNDIYQIVDNFSSKTDPSLLAGSCGISLFLFYYAKYKNEQEPYDKAFNILSNSLGAINKGLDYHTFSRGLAGVGYTVEHLSKHGFLDVDTQEILESIDGYLYEKMTFDLKNGRYDFLHGALGSGLYFFSRKAFNNKWMYLERLVDDLHILSRTDSFGLKWKSLLDYKTHKYGFNISLSHGISSIIAVLSKLYKVRINTKKTQQLIEGAVNYVLSQKLPSGNFHSIFPGWSIESSEKLVSSRLAWCYGDLGISVALWHASQALNRNDWEDEAINILLHLAKRRGLQKNSVVDAGLCHGTAGIAHIFNRMFKYTGLEDLQDASDYWFEETLKMAVFEDGLVGYKAYRAEVSGGWSNEYGLLEGIAGIGLALISAVSDIEPTWDECLLLS